MQAVLPRMLASGVHQVQLKLPQASDNSDEQGAATPCIRTLEHEHKQDVSWLLRTEPVVGYITTAEATARQGPGHVITSEPLARQVCGICINGEAPARQHPDKVTTVSSFCQAGS